jgi:hypothetical protein
VRAQRLRDLERDRLRGGQQLARPPGAPLRDALEDVLARALPDAGDADDPPRVARLLELRDGFDAELLEERARRPGPEPADLEEGGNVGGSPSRSASRRAMRPVARYSSILAPRSLPIPGSVRSAPRSASARTSSARVSRVCAPRW